MIAVERESGGVDFGTDPGQCLRMGLLQVADQRLPHMASEVLGSAGIGCAHRVSQLHGSVTSFRHLQVPNFAVPQAGVEQDSVQFMAYGIDRHPVIGMQGDRNQDIGRPPRPVLVGIFDEIGQRDDQSALKCLSVSG